MLQIKRGFVILTIVIGVLLGVILISAVLTLTITEPTGFVFNNSNISYILLSDETSDFYIFEDRLRSSSADKLCDDVTSCNITVRAREGENNITIKIINANGDIDSENIDFLVDTLSPRRITTKPRDNNYMNDSDIFSISYSEENLANITLRYGNTTQIKKLFKSSCESGKKKICEFSVNLDVFNGQEIKYWFDLVDIANNKANSSVKLVKIDTEKPFNKSQSFIINGNRVTFKFEIEEENFDKIILRDNSVVNPRWVRFCSVLVVGTCTANKYFRSGVHAIDVKVLDIAGNSKDIYSNKVIII